MTSPSLIDMMNRTGSTMAEKPKMWRPKKSEEAPKEEPRRMARVYANTKAKAGKPPKPTEGGRRSLYPKMMSRGG